MLGWFFIVFPTGERTTTRRTNNVISLFHHMGKNYLKGQAELWWVLVGTKLFIFFKNNIFSGCFNPNHCAFESCFVASHPQYLSQEVVCVSALRMHSWSGPNISGLYMLGNTRIGGTSWWANTHNCFWPTMGRWWNIEVSFDVCSYTLPWPIS